MTVRTFRSLLVARYVYCFLSNYSYFRVTYVVVVLEQKGVKMQKQILYRVYKIKLSVGPKRSEERISKKIVVRSTITYNYKTFSFEIDKTVLRGIG